SGGVSLVSGGQRWGLPRATILALQPYSRALRAPLDPPRGALADRLSRRLCLVGAGTDVFLGAAVVLVWPSLAGAWAAETLFAVAGALRSGADSALLYDTLRVDGRLDLYPHAESRGQAVASLGSGRAAVLGGVRAAVGLALPYVVTRMAAAAGAALAWTLDERRIGETSHAGAPHGRMREAAGVAWRTPTIRWAIAVAMLAVTASHVYFYLQQ